LAEEIEVDDGRITGIRATKLDGAGAVLGVDLDHGKSECSGRIKGNVGDCFKRPVPAEGKISNAKHEDVHLVASRVVGSEHECMRVAAGSGVGALALAPGVDARVRGEAKGALGVTGFRDAGVGFVGQANDGHFLVVLEMLAYAREVDEDGDVMLG